MAAKKPTNKMTEPRDRQMEGLKLPPHSLEAEQSVLGGLMLDNERWDNVSERVASKDFFSRPHRRIFTEMQRLLENSKPIDLITLSESLEQKGDLDSVGALPIWPNYPKTRQVRRISVLMPISCVNVPWFVK